MSVALEFWKDVLGDLGCVVCARGKGGGGGKVDQHHVARGSGKRHEFSRAVLCEEHHRQFHSGMGGKAFCRFYRPPGEEEFGLVVWTIEDAAKALRAREKREKTPEPRLGRGPGLKRPPI